MALAQQPAADAPAQAAQPVKPEPPTAPPTPIATPTDAVSPPVERVPEEVDIPLPKTVKPVVAPVVVPPPPPLLPPPPPPPPVRSPVAVLQVLDKITAETLRFAAPVGRRVRYKALVFTVKACETRGLSDPLPQPSAYVTIEAGAVDARGAPPKVVFKGWMIANAPSVHALEHPIYDAWLIACSTASPVG